MQTEAAGSARHFQRAASDHVSDGKEPRCVARFAALRRLLQNLQTAFRRALARFQGTLLEFQPLAFPFLGNIELRLFVGSRCAFCVRDQRRLHPLRPVESVCPLVDVLPTHSQLFANSRS
jgi:hypothetical protein